MAKRRTRRYHAKIKRLPKKRRIQQTNLLLWLLDLIAGNEK